MLRKRLALWGLISVATLGSVQAAAAQPPSAAHGEELVQARCGMCHTAGPSDGDGGVGPPLKGVVGRKAASVAGFNYTPALKASGLMWTRPNLDRFLSGPAKLVPGTAMPITVPSPKDRADIIAYLATIK